MIFSIEIGSRLVIRRNVSMTNGNKGLMAALFWIGISIVGLVLLLVGREMYSDTVAFKWIWRFVWFIGVPVLLLASYRTAVRGRSQSSDNTDDTKDSG